MDLYTTVNSIATLLLFVILLLAVIYSFVPIIMFALGFIYMNKDNENSYQENTDSINKTTVLMYIKSYVREVLFVLTFKNFLYFYGILRPKKNVHLNSKSNSKKKCAIILVHGYALNHTSWNWFKNQFSKEAVFTLDLYPKFGRIEEIAYKSLRPKIKYIYEQNKFEHIILIGHSMGGLVSSFYKEFLDDDNIVSKVISIATPYYGTKMSDFFIGPNGKQMSINSQFTKKLLSKIKHSENLYYQILSRMDQIIIPWKSSFVVGTPLERQLALPTEGHFSLLKSTVVIDQVKKWIDQH